MFLNLMRSVIVDTFTIAESEPMVDVLTVTSGELEGKQFVITNPVMTSLLESGPLVINFFTKGPRRKRFVQAWRGDFVLADLCSYEDARMVITS